MTSTTRSSASASASERRPSAAQRRILQALASRPGARILIGGHGRFVTDKRGWCPDVRVSEAQLTALVGAGWVLYMRSLATGRTEYALTVAGREAVKAAQ